MANAVTAYFDSNMKENRLQHSTGALTLSMEDNSYNRAFVDREYLVSNIRTIINQLNNDYPFDDDLVAEWVDYLILLLQGQKALLSDPYSDIGNYNIHSFSQSTPHLNEITCLYVLETLPNKSMPPADKQKSVLQKSLFILALGGADSTFYEGLEREATLSFAKVFYGLDLVAVFEKYDAVNLIPRGFAAKTDEKGSSITNAESIILQAYMAGVRNIAIIANTRTYRAIEEYLKLKFQNIHDLNIVVTAQPLLPRILVEQKNHTLNISLQNGGYPGGHGHGFKYCLKDANVQRLIQNQNLHYFIFSNGDNSVVFNWGGDHFTQVLQELEERKKEPANKNLRIAFFLVWEYLRKGGFSFLLEDKKTGEMMPQIFEAELARKSGADIDQLRKSKGGYNTNVAVGILQDVYSHLDELPMALKEKQNATGIVYTFEASLATAMTTRQRKDGSSLFDKNSSINILGPATATYQHWNHIALRKRDDLFAFHSSLFKIGQVRTAFGFYPVIYTDRDAGQKHPTLAGNYIDSRVLNTKEFFDIFKNATFVVDEFFGTLSIELMETNDLPRGIIIFRDVITLQGDENAELYIVVPAGELWIVQNKNFKLAKKRTMTPAEIIRQRWDAKTKKYI